MALVLLENSYLETGGSYLADVPEWETATTEAQEQALIDATSFLDENQWLGVAVSPTQPLAWPRVVDSFFDPVLQLYVPVADDEVPIRVQKATAQLALHIIRNPSVVESPYDVRYSSIEVGPISLSNGSSTTRPPSIPRVPSSVKILINPLISTSAANGSWWRAN